MDKNTLSNYGWIVIAVLVLSVMIALATPFGTYIENGVKSTTAGLFDTSEKALNVVGMTAGEGNFEDGSGETSTTNFPAKGKTLEEYTWAEVQQIVQAGASTEYGFNVGDTKTLTINGTTKTATIIGIDHDGENTATFMIVSPGGIGEHHMTGHLSTDVWETSAMREWLRTDIYNSMTDVKDYIKPVTKNNIGFNGTTASATQDKVFLLSPKEAGIENRFDCMYFYPDQYKPILETEGSTYAWFNSNEILDCFWFRSPADSNFFFYYYYGNLNNAWSDSEKTVCPAFVIG